MPSCTFPFFGTFSFPPSLPVLPSPAVTAPSAAGNIGDNTSVKQHQASTHFPICADSLLTPAQAQVPNSRPLNLNMSGPTLASSPAAMAQPVGRPWAPLHQPVGSPLLGTMVGAVPASSPSTLATQIPSQTQALGEPRSQPLLLGHGTLSKTSAHPAGPSHSLSPPATLDPKFAQQLHPLVPLSLQPHMPAVLSEPQAPGISSAQAPLRLAFAQASEKAQVQQGGCSPVSAPVMQNSTGEEQRQGAPGRVQQHEADLVSKSACSQKHLVEEANEQSDPRLDMADQHDPHATKGDALSAAIPRACSALSEQSPAPLPDHKETDKEQCAKASGDKPDEEQDASAHNNSIPTAEVERPKSAKEPEAHACMGMDAAPMNEAEVVTVAGTHNAGVSNTVSELDNAGNTPYAAPAPAKRLQASAPNGNTDVADARNCQTGVEQQGRKAQYGERQRNPDGGTNQVRSS